MKISIITTLYYSEPYLQAFYDRSKQTVLTLTTDYEFVIVNDGSPDGALELAKRLQEADERVVVVDLSRNFGHHKAIMTGLAYTTGDLVFLIDCDLEEAPETLPIFYRALQDNPTADAVYSVQDKREGSFFRRVAGDWYYRILRRISEQDIPQNILMTRLMTRRYVDDLVRFRENAFSIEGLWAMTGYHQVPVTIEKGYKGATTYNLSRKMWLAIYGITSMSSKPLIFIASLGLFITLPSGFLIVMFLVQYLTGYTQGVDGWTSLILSLWFLGGLIIFILGIIAIYISIIFTEVKPRPYTVVRAVYGRTPFPHRSPLQEQTPHDQR
jgi:putative glycosyltransferase